MRPLARMGVQTLVAVILLTLVVATAAIAIYTWLSGVTSTSPTEAQTLKERIRIDAVQYSAGTVTVTVRNIGDVQVTIAAGYVIDPNTETLVATLSNVNPSNVAPGATATVSGSATLTPGEVYLVKVVTESGIEARATFIAP